MSTPQTPILSLRELSLESMPAPTRFKTPRVFSEAETDANDSASEVDDLDEHIVRSPFTGLLYDISKLDQETIEVGSSRLVQDEGIQGQLKDLFDNERRWYETPPINLQFTGMGKYNDGNEFYAFQLHEFNPVSIRIGTPRSAWPKPQCFCRDRRPCKHMIWLYDAIAKLTLYDHDYKEPLAVGSDGSLPVLGDVYSRIADFRLDMLTEGMHAAVGSSDVYGGPPGNRINEVKHILSAFDGFEDDDGLHTFGPPRHDTSPRKKRNLGETVRELLLQNDEVFAMFLNLLPRWEKARNPYMKLQARFDRVLEELDDYSKSQGDHQLAADRRARGADIEGKCDVNWAATHVLGVARQIRNELLRSSSAMFGSEAPPVMGLEAWEKRDAARALVHMLKKVVFDHNVDRKGCGRRAEERNMYRRLVNNTAGDTGFAVEVLELVADQTMYIDELEAVRRKLMEEGVNAVFLGRLEGVIEGMRKCAARDGEEEGEKAVAGDSLGGAGAGVSRTSSSAGSVGKKRRRVDE